MAGGWGIRGQVFAWDQQWFKHDRGCCDRGKAVVVGACPFQGKEGITHAPELPHWGVEAGGAGLLGLCSQKAEPRTIVRFRDLM